MSEDTHTTQDNQFRTPPILNQSANVPPDQGVKLETKDVLFSYKGRIGVGQYWGHFVLLWITLFVVQFLAYSASFEAGDGISGLLLIPGIWVGTALGVKRLHDQGKSGAMMFLLLIPLAGPIIWLVLTLLASQLAPNQYGPSVGNRY